jgi:hypothetical protein
MSHLSAEQLDAALAQCAGGIRPHGVLRTLSEPELIIGKRLTTDSTRC